MLALYKNIKELRELKGMSQDALAKMTGYSDRSSIAKIEKGLVDLQQSKIELFAKALGTTTEELVGWKAAGSEAPLEIMEYYNQLNATGQREAVKRVEELTYVSKYTDSSSNVVKIPNQDYLAPYAAHEREGIDITEEMRKADDNIMNDENF